MRFWRTRRATGIPLTLLLLIHAGCGSGRIQLEKEELVDPAPAKSYLVTLNDGSELTFISLHLEGDWLMGTARITSSETVGEGEEARTSVTNRYEEMKIAWSHVDKVEAYTKKGTSSHFLLVAGGVALGAGIFLLLSGGSDSSPTNGGGKEPPGN